MISLFITATIVWRMNTLPKICGVAEPGCYVEDTNTIYMTKNKTNYAGISKDFILYHEIGHSLYKKNFPITIFGDGGMGDPSYEMIANDFAWWVYGQKYSKQYSYFVFGEVLDHDQINYFNETCDNQCLKQILAIKTK